MMRETKFLLTVLAFSPVFLTGCGDQKPPTMNVAVSCTDGKMNGSETGVDCGGSCKACMDPAVCKVPSECTSGVCMTPKCMPPTCDDGVQNQGEAEIDCGGPCAACTTDNPDMTTVVKSCDSTHSMPTGMCPATPYQFKDTPVTNCRWVWGGTSNKTRIETTSDGLVSIYWNDGGAFVCSGKHCWHNCQGEEPANYCLRLRVPDDQVNDPKKLVVEGFKPGHDPMVDPNPDSVEKMGYRDQFDCP